MALPKEFAVVFEGLARTTRLHFRGLRQPGIGSGWTLQRENVQKLVDTWSDDRQATKIMREEVQETSFWADKTLAIGRISYQPSQYEGIYALVGDMGGGVLTKSANKDE